MRPQSIIVFERLFLASLVLSTINFVVGYDAAMAAVTAVPLLAELDIGGEVLVGSMIVGTAIYLLLWFLIARKASNVARWLLVALTILGVLSYLASLSAPAAFSNAMSALSLAYYVLAVAAVAFLFRDDAGAWLRGDGRADPAAFD